MKIELEVTLTKGQETLLQRIGNAGENGLELTDLDSDEEEEDMYQLTHVGVVEDIMGEQFYLTRLGEKYIKNLSDAKS